MSPRKVLIVARYFPPSSLVGGQRPLKLARRLEEHGWEPIILTTHEECMGPIDPSLIRDVEHLHIERTPCWSLWHHGKWWRNERGFRRGLDFTYNAISKFTHKYLPLDISYPWAVMTAKRGIALVKELGIDLIWATAPPESALELAYRISKATDIPFIADYRDVKINFEGKQTNYRKTDAALTQAAGISYVSPAHEPLLAKNFPHLKKTPRKLIYNWFEPEERKHLSTEPGSDFTLLHGGNLYAGSRDTTAFMQALAEFNQNAGEKQALFIQHGPKNTAHLVQQSRDVGCEDALSIRPPLTRIPFLEACAKATVLLLVVGHDSGDAQHAGAIPGKLYDYFLANRPILVIGPKECVAGEMVTQYKRGLHIADTDKQGILKALETLSGEHGCQLASEVVHDFSAEVMVGKMAAFFDEIAKKAK